MSTHDKSLNDVAEILESSHRWLAGRVDLWDDGEPSHFRDPEQFSMTVDREQMQICLHNMHKTAQFMRRLAVRLALEQEVGQ